jgi:ATP-dependent exoDNAse (exonuclease V) beta subunit
VGAAFFAWDMLGDMASLRGQPCTATVSPCLINGECRRLTWPRHFVEDLHKELTSKYVLAKTELLVYSLELRMAGQVDLLMRNEDSTEYHILDYKFIKEPLESYYNRFTRKYKMMSGPFSRLMDTNYSHYSIQLEIYRYLMGAVGRKVKTKRLMVVTQKATSLFTRSR